MKEWGRIIALKGKTAVLSMQKNEDCEKCGKCRAGREENEMIMEVKNNVGAQIGDTVEVTDQSRSLPVRLFIRIGIPAIDGIIGGIIGYMIAKLFSQTNIIIWVGIFCIISIILSYFFSKKLLTNIENFKSNEFVITSIVLKSQ